MKRKIFFLILTAFVLISVFNLSASKEINKMTNRRFAFIIGANDGGPDRVKLRYAVSDAKAIIKVLEDMGGVLSPDIRFLKEPSREKLFREIIKLKEEVTVSKSKFRRTEVIFYYSGHSDEQNILLGQEKVSYLDLRNTINSITADVRIAILDSCASGAFNLLKGTTKRSPFLINTAYDMKGFAFMTSSSSHEASQESGRLEGSFFTHHLVSGLRGAADMTQDGIITLNEAYQYAYKETLTETEKTASGPQHPSYNIQMSGKGDVIMTDIRQSSAVLIIDKNIFGRIFIHNQHNFLVVEINKPFGQTVEIGLETGKYRLINIREGDIFETKITLTKGKLNHLELDQFEKIDKIFTTPRGKLTRFLRPEKLTKIKNRWQIEFFGGFSGVQPEDLNLRILNSQANEEWWEDRCEYLRNNGDITSIGIFKEGEYQIIENATPFGSRVKYFLSQSVSLSLGFRYLSKNQASNIRRTYDLYNGNELVYSINEQTSPYIIATKAYIPTVGIHFSKTLSKTFEIEGFLKSGPVFAQCRIYWDFEVMELNNSDNILEDPEFELQEVEEHGNGVGIGLDVGARLNITTGNHSGIFLEAGYAFQQVRDLSGQGNRTQDFVTDSWQGEWGMKERYREEPWGNLRENWPSNYWEAENKYPKVRDFKLDLSAWYFRIGFSYRLKK